eukprot:scaffold23223_cov33-Tisochrysis_lutea.AAC.4
MQWRKLARDRRIRIAAYGTGAGARNSATIFLAHLTQDGAGIVIVGMIGNDAISTQVNAHAGHVHPPSCRGDIDEVTVNLEVQRPCVRARPAPRGDNALVRIRLVDHVVMQVGECTNQ